MVKLLILRSRRHYEDCYEILVDMFAITTMLTPRTKRWAEAKVLADCLTVKVRYFTTAFQYSRLTNLYCRYQKCIYT